MNLRTRISNFAAFLAVAALASAPMTALADHGQGNGKGKGNSGSHWNPAPPKKNGRHDNRDWNKGNDDRNRYYDSRSDSYRRWEDVRSWNDRARLSAADQRRLDDLRRRYPNLSYADAAAVEARRKRQTANEWRNIAIVSGAVGVIGLLKHDKTLTFVGAAGALYSLYRYQKDRSSANAADRLRASYFSRPYFVRDGVRYDRRLVTQNGQRYYQFVRR